MARRKESFSFILFFFRHDRSSLKKRVVLLWALSNMAHFFDPVKVIVFMENFEKFKLFFEKFEELLKL